MGKPQKRKRNHKNIKDFKKKFRLRNRTKDLDEIHAEIQPEKIDQILHQKIDPDLPGLGQFYCVFCAKYFMNQQTQDLHNKTKKHKKRIRLLKDKPYTQAEAEMAAGMGSYTVSPSDHVLPPILEANLNTRTSGTKVSHNKNMTDTANIMETLDIS